jgi:hypothetical protein
LIIMRVAIASSVAAAVLLSGPAQGQDKNPVAEAPPVSVGAMIGCRATADAAARLACYDKAVGSLQQAVAKREVVIFSAADVRKTRRSLFGFSIPKLPFFGDSDDTPEAREINAKIKSTRSLGYGKWRIQLEDGEIWETTEGSSSSSDPSVGGSVRIRKAALGSYLLSISGSKSVRARRVS